VQDYRFPVARVRVTWREITAFGVKQKEGQSSRSIHSLTPDALSSGQQGLQTQKSHRTHVLQAQELATHRNPK
jgi:hypothetical protein